MRLWRRVRGALAISTATNAPSALAAQATSLDLCPSLVSAGRLPLILALAPGHQRGLAGLAHGSGDFTCGGTGVAASPATIRSCHAVRFAGLQYVAGRECSKT